MRTSNAYLASLAILVKASNTYLASLILCVVNFFVVQLGDAFPTSSRFSIVLKPLHLGGSS